MTARPGQLFPPVRSAGGSIDIVRTLGADYAWRAAEGSNALLSPYIGSLALSKFGAGQSAPAPSAALNGQLSMACAAANLGYGASDGGADAAFSIVTVGVNASPGASAGFAATTAAGFGVNSGVSQFATNSTIFSRRGAPLVDATSVKLTPYSFVVLTIANGAGVTGYHSKLTPVSTALAGAVASDSKLIMGLSNAGFGMIGEWALTAMWRRALSGAEAALLLAQLGARYGVTIGP